MQPNNFFSLEQVIDRQPLIVAPKTPLTEVIKQMQEWANSCYLSEHNSDADYTGRINNSCALVIEAAQLQGIFTERDLVRLIASERNLAEITVGEVMSRELISLTSSGTEDVFTALNLLRQHSIRHLPILDNRDYLLGLISEKSLRQTLQPINLMKWRRVMEIMETNTIHAEPNVSIRQAAKLMAEHRVSYVAIVEPDNERNGLLIPVGIITERDIVQFQTLNLDLAQSVQRLMSTPLFLVNPEDSLWEVHQQMQQRRVRRLLVAGSQGELKGIITQTKLLQVFDPSEMYGVIEVLQRQVCRLKIEREALLEQRNHELEQEVQERTAVIETKKQQLKSNQAELRKAHQELSYHLNNSPLAVVEWDRNFCVQRWSDRAEQIFGWQKAEVLGKNWRDWQFVLEEDLDRVTEITDRLLNGTKVRDVSHNRNYTKDGSIIDCEWYSSVLQSESGDVMSILTLLQDVSDRTYVESKLRIQAKQQRAIAEIGQYALVEQDLVALMERAVNLVARTLDVEYCKVLELLPDGKNLLLKVGVGWHEGLVGTATVRADTNSQAGYTLLSSEPVVVTDLLAETRFSGPNLLLDHQVVGGISVIIAGNDKPYGILGIHTTQQRNFSPDNVNFIQTIANILAQAIERKQTEVSLRESQERYALAVEGSSNGLWDWNVSTNEVFFAPRFKAIIGYADTEMPNTFEAWSSKLHPEDRGRVLAALQDHLENRVPYNIEYRLQTKSQEYYWVNARGQAIWDKNGQAVRMAGSITDISGRKHREEVLKDIALGMSVEIGKKFLPSLVEYLSKTLQVDYAYVGELIQPEKKQIKTWAIYDRGEAIDNVEYDLAGTPCEKVVSGELCVYSQAVQQLFPNDRFLQTISAESYAGMPIVNAAGKVLGLISVIDRQPFKDISLIEEVLKIFANRATTELERQEAELALRQSEQKFRAIFDQSFQFIGLLKPNGNIIEANQTALDFVGLTLADVRGKPFWETPWWSMSQSDREVLKQAIDRAAQGEFVRFEVQHPGTEDRVVTVDFSLTPVKDETGQVVMLIPEGRNISDRKQVEADLQKSNQLLQAISWIQTQFLADAEPAMLFDGILDRLLDLTKSEYGYIGEIIFATDGSPMIEESYMKVRGRPYLKTHAITDDTSPRIEFGGRILTNIAWNEETRAFYAENASKGMEFHNLQTLFGAVMVTGEPVIANSPSDDPRRGGLPDGHPPLDAFLGVPFYKNERMTGMVGIANRQGGYDEAIVDYLQPFLDTCSRIIEVYKSDRQRQQAAAKIRQQAALLDLTHDTILVRNLDNIITFWNHGAVEMYGWSVVEALGKNSHQLLNAQFSQSLAEIETQLFHTGRWEGELTHYRKDGSSVVVMGRWSLLKDEQGNPQQILEINHDISERKQAELKIREQAALLDITTDAIMVRRLDNTILYWNRGAENLYGWTRKEALEQDANELLYRESLAKLTKIQQTVKQQGEWQGELNQVTKVGKEIIVESRWTLVKDDSNHPQSYLVVNTDITEQKQLEAQFLRTQRLESLGTLAGGIAHDLNNILAPILGFSRLLPLKLPNVDEQTKGFFKIMETNARRGSALVKQILTFSRGLEGDRGIVQIRHLINEIGQIITETFPKSIELDLNAPKNLWTVNGDINQLHQVLMNLAVNARDAMPDGGRLTIEAENFIVDADYTRLHLDASEGSYILITVTDTGVGISPEVIDRIFEPFFTTKEIGKGTGLGLSTVIGIVRSHGGFVDVVSDTKGKTRGTQVKVFLPASETTEAAAEVTEEIPQGHGELILVVDDESSILAVTKATLETYNYKVLTASNGIEAIAIYAQNLKTINLVIMDIMMPEMSGKTAIRTLKQINPEVKIIAVSGLISSREIVAEIDDNISAYLAKPFSNDDLLQTIYQVIDRKKLDNVASVTS